MSELARFTVGDGEVLVEAWEVEAPAGGTMTRASGADGAGVDKAAEKLDTALQSVLPAAERVMNGLKKLQPTSTEIEFGIKLSGEAGAWLAKTGAEANFAVKMTWEKSEDGVVPATPVRAQS